MLLAFVLSTKLQTVKARQDATATTQPTNEINDKMDAILRDSTTITYVEQFKQFVLMDIMATPIICFACLAFVAVLENVALLVLVHQVIVIHIQCSAVSGLLLVTRKTRCNTTKTRNWDDLSTNECLFVLLSKSRVVYISLHKRDTVKYENFCLLV